MAVTIKGRSMGSIKRARDSLKQGSGGGTFLKRVPEDGLAVRFLTEPDKWFGYSEHYDETLRSYYPCIEGACPGCQEGLRASFRYATNVLDVAEDRVLPLILAKDAANRVMIRHDRYGTLLDRDYLLTRDGTGFDTTYDVESEGKKTRSLAKYDLIDLQEAISQQFDRTFNASNEDEDDEDEKPVRRTGTKARTKTSSAAKASTPKSRVVGRRRAGVTKAEAPPKKVVTRKAITKTPSSARTGTMRRRAR